MAAIGPDNTRHSLKVFAAPRTWAKFINKSVVYLYLGRGDSPIGLTRMIPWTWVPWFFRRAVNSFTPGQRTWKSNSLINPHTVKAAYYWFPNYFNPLHEPADHWNKTYLQKRKQQSHMFWILNELVCKLGSQIICLFLGILICQGDGRLQLVTSSV